MKLRSDALPVVGLLALLGTARPALCQRQQIEFSDDAVAEAIDRAKKHLWSLYREDPRQDPWPDMRTQRVSYTDARGRQRFRQEPYVNYSGRSALAMYALLASGENYTDARMKRAIEWLARIDTRGTYTLGVRMQVWTFLPDRIARPLLIRDCDRLIKSIGRPPQGWRGNTWNHQWGTHTYGSSGRPSQRGDHSNTHIGILGVWAAARMNLEVPKDYWQLVFQHYVRSQSVDGTWRYSTSPGPTPPPGEGYGQYPPGGMTAAGLANLLVAWESVHAADFVRVGKNPDLRSVVKALEWFGKNPNGHPNGYHYYLFSLERAGLASGYKFFGNWDWYRSGATRLINSQRADGSWRRAGFGDNSDFVATCFGLLFLARGRNPVMFNRLWYKGDWNNRPGALSHVTRWVSRRFEREINWQIVNLETPPEQWHDSQILLISGAKGPKFTPEEIGKLRSFVFQGGMILSVTEGGTIGRAFDRAMRKTYGEMFPNYELKPVPKDHLIFRKHFPLRRGMRFEAASNGARVLAMHTTVDLMLPWQRNAHVTSVNTFKLAANISYFANEEAIGRPRAARGWPAKKPFTALRSVRVARVKYAGNWDPEPLAWQRLERLMGQKWQTDLTVTPGVTLKELDAKKWPLATITGTGKLTLDKEEEKALADYVRAGGTVLLDAAGGSEAFAGSAAVLLERLFGEDSLRRLPSAAAVYDLPGMKIGTVKYRRAARDRFGGDRARLLAVELGGRAAVFLSKQDLTVGLVGGPCQGCVGYHPSSAVELVRNIILYAGGVGRSGPGATSRPREC